MNFSQLKYTKFQNGLSPPIINDILILGQNIYNLRKFQELSASTKSTRGPQLRSLNRDNIKLEPTL